MNWFVIYAQGHHGYPQPEESYERVVYSSTCPRCGIYEAQVAPFRVKREIGAPHSHFVQLNWVFDTFFARQSVADTLERAGITGISFSSVIDHRSGETVADIWQLCMSTTISCAEVSRLPTVTCRPDNEESRWELPGPKRYPQMPRTALASNTIRQHRSRSTRPH